MEILNSLITNPELAEKISVNVSARDLISFARELAIQLKPEPATTPPAEKYFTPDETAEILKVSRVTLWQWNRKGILRAKKVGNVLRYLKSDIETALIGRA